MVVYKYMKKGKAHITCFNPKTIVRINKSLIVGDTEPIFFCSSGPLSTDTKYVTLHLQYCILQSIHMHISLLIVHLAGPWIQQ